MPWELMSEARLLITPGALNNRILISKSMSLTVVALRIETPTEVDVLRQVLSKSYAIVPFEAISGSPLLYLVVAKLLRTRMAWAIDLKDHGLRKKVAPLCAVQGIVGTL